MLDIIDPIPFQHRASRLKIFQVSLSLLGQAMIFASNATTFTTLLKYSICLSRNRVLMGLSQSGCTGEDRDDVSWVGRYHPPSSVKSKKNLLATSWGGKELLEALRSSDQSYCMRSILEDWESNLFCWMYRHLCREW